MPSELDMGLVEVVADVLASGGVPSPHDYSMATRVAAAVVEFECRDADYSRLLAEDDPTLHVSGYGE